MAKGKKSKKDVVSDEEISSDEVEDDTKPKASAKNKKKGSTELEDDLENLKIDDNKKKVNKKPADTADDSEEEVEAPVKPKKGGFALLMDDGDDSLPSEQSEEEEIPKPVPKKKEKSEKKKKKVTKEEDEEPQLDEEPKEEKGGKKKKKKKGKKGGEEDEDLDAMLAALRAEYDGEPAPEPAKSEDKPEEKKGKKGKGKKKEETVVEDGFEIIEKEDTELSEKALKKKEKRERQKQKEATPVEEPTKVEKPAEESEVLDEENQGDETEKKGKKKKGKKEEEEKKKKKPNKAILAAMQEALAKQKEEEEKIKKEEEEKERLAEEAFQAKLKAKELDEEKKRLKKEREKLKKEELKKQGLLLSKAEREKKARAEAMLAAMRAQGVDVPAIGEKRPRPGTRKRMNQKMRHHQPEPETPKEKEEEDKSTSEEPAEQPKEESKVEEPKEEVADSWDAEDDIKDSWDAESDGEKEQKPAEEKVEKKEETPTTEDNEDNDEEEESDEESEEEDESEDESDEESSSEEEEDRTEDTRERAIHRIRDRMARNEAARTTDVLRSPVVCVLGHVDVGKTKILDKLRKTNVQDGEAGGITQQIGATNVPIHVIQEQCKMVKGFGGSALKLPGLLIIDTPGHESFSNLRDRGSSLCDIAVLVIDIMHGLEPQTIESLNMLKKKKVPFIVALNKVDRLYEWKSNRHKDIRDVIDSQPNNTKMEFFKRKDEVILGLAEQGMNAALFYENPDPADYISLVPTSAHSGDGMGNLMAAIVQHSQDCLAKRLSYTEELQCTILEVKAIGGFGTTIDVCLVNGRLKFGQTIILPGTEGPIVTTVRALLTPSKMQDLRVKNQFTEHKELKAAQGVKIAAKELEKTIAGLSLRVANSPDEVNILREEAERDLSSALNAIKLKPLGVFVQASTLGSLEALLEFLKTSKIPYAGVKIGPVVKKDVMRASTMLEHEEKYAVILAFDVKVEREAQEMADREGVKIFQADIIYHLFDRFTEYQAELIRQKKEQFRSIAVFPCKLRILPEHIFTRRDPITVGVKVEAGVCRTGTPICVPTKEFIFLGILTGIQHNQKEIDSAKKGEEVCIKIEAPGGDAPKMFGRHFDEKDVLMSRISRESIDACKDYFRDELQKSDWALMVELKKIFQIL